MEKKQKYILIAIAFALVVLCSGLTYAYFTSATPSESGSTIVAKGGTMNITYANGSGDIVMENIYPREKEWVNKTFTITGRNTTDLEMEYTIYLVTKSNSFSFLSLAYTLIGTSTNSDDILDDVSNMTPLSGDIGELAIGSGVFKSKNATHTYSLKIYFPDFGEEQDYDQGKSYTGYVSIEPAAPANWNNAGARTLLAGIKQNYPTPTSMETDPMSEPSSSTEAVMASTVDDYGTTYFFRGAVQNNFVSFAGMCWRIVRITGDGSIKLVLYDYSSAECTNSGIYNGFIRNSSGTSKLAPSFNTLSTDNAYIGFMYGTPNSSTYNSTHANINKSNVLKELETWYQNNLADYSDKLSDVIWCNDKHTLELGYGTITSNYNNRFNDNSGPSYICHKDNSDGKLSMYTVSDKTYGNGNLDYPIGLLTADELIFAGLPYSEDNKALKTSYIVANAELDYYWTLSPNNFNSDAYMLVVTDYGNVTYRKVNAIASIRPSIALKSTTTISGGDGTAVNPFVVN